MGSSLQDMGPADERTIYTQKRFRVAAMLVLRLPQGLFQGFRGDTYYHRP